MSERFIIVIEADNKRAKAAYDKGLADLALVWPQLMTHAGKFDAAEQIKYQKKIAEREAEEKAYWAASEKYQKELNEWEKGSFLRGAKPIRPLRLFQIGLLPSDFLIRPFSLRENYESIRDSLRRMADIAGAAIGPYRMTEYQVTEMIRWEIGSKIESLMAEIGTAA